VNSLVITQRLQFNSWANPAGSTNVQAKYTSGKTAKI
jgi:hypothetical protein